jgi:predicted AAA+ superfamily ATPase
METTLPQYRRKAALVLASRLREPRRFLQVVTGPRQVGKSTAVQQVLAEWEAPAWYASADLPAPPDHAWIEQQWQLARSRVRPGELAALALDEVQKVAGWAETVKRLWDEDTYAGRPLQVVVLGSSALLVQRGLTESLAGRFELIRCLHWSWAECRQCFGWSLDRYLYFGGYPGAAQLADDWARWATYVRDALIETALSKDVLLLTRVEKPALLRQLFVLACRHAGEIVSYQKMLGQLADAGNTTTLAHYQHLLEGAYLLRGLQKWSGVAIRRRASSPKWLPLNTALATALSGKSPDDWRSAPDLWGRLVETAVGAHLVNGAEHNGYEVHYWREGNHEVDFVLRQGDALVGIEVKSGRRPYQLTGLQAFQAHHRPQRSLVVGTGGVPLEEFLETPPETWLKS